MNISCMILSDVHFLSMTAKLSVYYMMCRYVLCVFHWYV